MSARDFPIVPAGPLAMLVPVIAGASALALLAGVLIAGDAKTDDWLRASPPFFLVLLVMPVVAWRVARRSVRLDERGLDVHRLPWSRPVPIADFDLDRAEIVDLSRHAALKPTIKLIGSRMPGYRSGHFRLRNGARASLAVTDERRVLVLPRRNGNYVMLSVESPAALLEALRRAAARRG